MLVAFDTSGNRLGRGGGYYDLSFSFLLDPIPTHRPYLIGLGYDFQATHMLRPAPWDIPLQEVITEKNHYHF